MLTVNENRCCDPLIRMGSEINLKLSLLPILIRSSAILIMRVKHPLGKLNIDNSWNGKIQKII